MFPSLVHVQLKLHEEAIKIPYTSNSQMFKRIHKAQMNFNRRQMKGTLWSFGD